MLCLLERWADKGTGREMAEMRLCENRKNENREQKTVKRWGRVVWCRGLRGEREICEILLRNFASWEFFRHPGKLGIFKSFDFSFKIRKSILKIKFVIILKHFVSTTKKEDSWRKQFN
jgi:hypothetical protein